MSRRELLIAGSAVGDDHPCYVIAEIGSNHQGDVDLCAQMIEAAAASGASAVKLQKRDVDNLFTASFGASPYSGPHAFGSTYVEHRRELELSEAGWRDLIELARLSDVDFIATAFDERSAEFLAEIGVAAVKVASGDATNLPLVERLIDLKLPILASTGGLDWPEVDRLVEVLSDAVGAAILQCTSIYPCPPANVELSVIAEMRTRYPGIVVGYSGHELGIGPSVGAVALGAAIVERHFTTDRSLRGSDQHMSILPGELAELVRHAEATRQAVGTGEKACHPDERPALRKLGKKLVAARPLGVGQVLSADDLAVRSPGDGLSPALLSEVVGRQLRRGLEADEDIALDDLEPIRPTSTLTAPWVPNFRCDDRIAVVTGAAGNLGPLWARSLTAVGATTIAVAQPGTEDRPEVEGLAKLGIEILTADVTDANSLATTADLVGRRWGPPDILVASAGIDSAPVEGHTFDLGTLQADEIAPVLHTNTVGTLLTVSAFGGPMVAARRGSIILVGSQYALVSPRPSIYTDAGMRFTKNPAYGASKAAILQLARYFSAHWSSSGVRVNALCPGGIEGDQTPRFKRRFAEELPLGRMLRPDELQGALIFLASDASSAMTGAHLVVDGGYTAW